MKTPVYLDIWLPVPQGQGQERRRYGTWLHVPQGQGQERRRYSTKVFCLSPKRPTSLLVLLVLLAVPLDRG